MKVHTCIFTIFPVIFLFLPLRDYEVVVSRIAVDSFGLNGPGAQVAYLSEDLSWWGVL